LKDGFAHGADPLCRSLGGARQQRETLKEEVGGARDKEEKRADNRGMSAVLR